jgi:hypothetical protein
VRKHFTPALAISLVALVMSSTGLASAARHAAIKMFDGRPVSTKPHKGGLLLLGKNREFPTAAIPVAPETSRLGGETASELEPACPSNTADLGTWCLEKQLVGQGSYFGASQDCAGKGGFLPSASELVGAVKDVELAGGPATPGQREMSSTLITTQAGSQAAGSEPADPEPETAQYVTVFSDRGDGGLDGGVPVKDPENFRCAYLKTRQQ